VDERRDRNVRPDDAVEEKVYGLRMLDLMTPNEIVLSLRAKKLVETIGRNLAEKPKVPP
jgi:hypothetical protein